MTALILYVQDTKAKIRVAYRRWFDRRKVALVAWLLETDAVADKVVSVVIEDSVVEQMVDRAATNIAEDAVSDAIQELEREREREGGPHADSIDGLDDAIDERIDRACGNSDFDRAVEQVIDGHEFTTDDFKDLPQLVQEISDERIAQWARDNVDELKKLLGVQS